MKFSIVIPTLNRAAKLVYALRSATRQTFRDYEVVVSDNRCDDETARVIAENATDRVRMVMPPHRMSMPDHWEFALQQTRGDRILILGDDDALLPNSLEQLDRVATASADPDLIQYRSFTYIYNDGVRDADGSTIALPPRVRDGWVPLSLTECLRLRYWRLDGNMPRLLNCVVHRRVLDRVRETCGRLFGIWAPDFAVGVRLLTLSKSAVRTGSLAIWGENMQSYGSGARRDPAVLREFLDQHPEWTGRFERSPYPDLMVLSNMVYDTLAIAREQLGLAERDYPIDPINFRRRLLKELRTYAGQGVSGMDEWRNRVDADRRRVRLKCGLSPAFWSASIRNSLRNHREKKQLASGGIRNEATKTLRFPNILDAAVFAGSLPRAA